ncbi:putative hemolysin [Paramixta manurensis]
MIAIATLTACATKPEEPKRVGMANPASVYCEKIGGKLDTVKETNGEVGYCTLPSGERIEEWALYRRDNK